MVRAAAVRIFASFFVVLFGLAAATPAHADDTKATHRKNEVYWHDEWSKFTWNEALISVAVTAHNLNLEKALDGPKEASVEFYVPLMDKEWRSLLVETNLSRRQAYARLSDIGYKSLVFAPYAIDVMMTLAVHRNPEVAAQLFLIDFEVFTLAAATQMLISRLIGRARPYVADLCDGDKPCPGGPYRSLVSGHTMAAFTAAGLMCLHHEMLPIFGGGLPDKWACAWAVSVASVTGFMRLPADEHYMSDVLMGAGLGFFYGYFIPKWLHFHKPGTDTKNPGSKSASTFRMMPSMLPTGDGGGGTLSLSGIF